MILEEGCGLPEVLEKKIEKQLKKLGIRVVKPHFSAVVLGTEGPLEEGAIDKARQTGIEITKLET